MLPALTLSLFLTCARAPSLPQLSPSDPTAPVPKTVVLLIDCTTRADRLGAYGNARRTSPYLDALAAQGTRFAHTLGSASWTRPAVAALMTGRHPYALGIDPEQTGGSFAAGLAPEALTLAERFAAAGWRTAGITANPNVNSRLGMAQGFDVYVDTTTWKGRRDKQPGPDVVARWLHLANKVDGALYGQIVLVDTHNPLSSDRRRRLRLGLWPLSTGALLDRYDAALTRLDDALIALDQGLATLGRADRLLVVVGDHGEGLFRPRWAGRGHSHYLYDANLRVPWVLNGPGVAPNHVVRGLSSSVDIAPTIADLAGLPAVDGDGMDLRAAVSGQVDQTGERQVVSMTRYGPVDRGRLTTQDWVLIENTANGGHKSRGPVELYDASDRTQAHDLVADRPNLATELRGVLDEQVRTWESSALQWEGDMSDDVREQLQALGYVEQ